MDEVVRKEARIKTRVQTVQKRQKVHVEAHPTLQAFPQQQEIKIQIKTGLYLVSLVCLQQDGENL